MQLKTRHLGALAGLAAGWLIVQYGLIAAVFIAVAGGVGWVVGRVLDGEIDIADYIRRRQGEDLE